MKRVFLKSAVRVVARDGLERVTTKAIAREAHLNEAYIYKCFSGKDELLDAALHQEDADYAAMLLDAAPVLFDTSRSWKERAFALWEQSWAFILEERDDCIFYIRFYFAALGMSSVFGKHMESYQSLLEQIRPFFKPDANIDMVIHQVFCTMLFFASRVMDGDLPDSDETTRWAFEQVYSFLAPNIRPEVLGEAAASARSTTSEGNAERLPYNFKEENL